ncbi:hypothetical protein F968_01145 [Acinetobacter sp. NIPH 817]|nr:hypothetical protein F968_01145 [Acinetobacter sp. NIPH 817]
MSYFNKYSKYHFKFLKVKIVSNQTKFIFGSIIVILFIAGYSYFKDLNLVNWGQKAGSSAGNEINKNMNNN